MRLSPDDRLRPRERVLCKEVDGEAVLLDLETETYFGLNETGARLWVLLTGAPTIGRALETMLEEYDVPREALERDVDDLVERLVTAGLARVGNA